MRPPLDGLLVADFSRVLAGPSVSMLLADLGAEVIKVERPGSGDDTRAWGPPWTEHTSSYFESVNRTKHSVVLDLTNESDRALARELVARADVLMENFRTGTMERLGLGYDEVSRLNPGIVYCSLTGFGSAAGASLPGYDFVVQAVGGLMSITGEADGSPTKVGVALVDVLTGLHATIAVLAALRERETSGRGQHVEVNLLSSLLASLVNQGAGYINGAGVPAAMGNQHPSIAPYETLATSGRPLAVAVGNDRQFATMAQAVGRADLASDPRFVTNRDRVAHREELVGELEAALAGRDAADWTKLLGDRGIPCGPVNDLAEAIAFADSLDLAPVVFLPSPTGDIATLASPLTLHRTPVRYHRAPPTLGADSDAVRRWLEADGNAL